MNGKVAEIGATVLPGQDRVLFDGEPVVGLKTRTVILLHKPRGYLTSCRRGREAGRLVTELVPSNRRLYPVGRLDRDSEGLLLLTDDGELAQLLAHPRFAKEKEYEVELERVPDPGILIRLVRGVRLDEGIARAVEANLSRERMVSVVLTEGRKRQLRRMFAALGHRVVSLRRVRVAGLTLGRLRPGEWRRLSESEIRRRLLVRPQ